MGRKAHTENSDVYYARPGIEALTPNHQGRKAQEEAKTHRKLFVNPAYNNNGS